MGAKGADHASSTLAENIEHISTRLGEVREILASLNGKLQTDPGERAKRLFDVATRRIDTIITACEDGDFSHVQRPFDGLALALRLVHEKCEAVRVSTLDRPIETAVYAIGRRTDLTGADDEIVRLVAEEASAHDRGNVVFTCEPEYLRGELQRIDGIMSGLKPVVSTLNKCSESVAPATMASPRRLLGRFDLGSLFRRNTPPAVVVRVESTLASAPSTTRLTTAADGRFEVTAISSVYGADVPRVTEMVKMYNAFVTRTDVPFATKGKLGQLARLLQQGAAVSELETLFAVVQPVLADLPAVALREDAAAASSPSALPARVTTASSGEVVSAADMTPEQKYLALIAYLEIHSTDVLAGEIRAMIATSDAGNFEEANKLAEALFKRLPPAAQTYRASQPAAPRAVPVIPIAPPAIRPERMADPEAELREIPEQHLRTKLTTKFQQAVLHFHLATSTEMQYLSPAMPNRFEKEFIRRAQALRIFHAKHALALNGGTIEFAPTCELIVVEDVTDLQLEKFRTLYPTIRVARKGEENAAPPPRTGVVSDTACHSQDDAVYVGASAPQTPAADDASTSHTLAAPESAASTALPPDWHYFDTVGKKSDQPTATLARDRDGALSDDELAFLMTATDVSTLQISADALVDLPEIPTHITQLILPLATPQSDLSILAVRYGDRLHIETSEGHYQTVEALAPLSSDADSEPADTPADGETVADVPDAAEHATYVAAPSHRHPEPVDATSIDTAALVTPSVLTSIHTLVHGATLGNGADQLRTRPTELERFQRLRIAMCDRRIAVLQARVSKLDSQRAGQGVLTNDENAQLRSDIAELRAILGLSEDETLAEYLQTLGIPAGESIADYLARVMDESATAHAAEMSDVLTRLSQVEARMHAERSTEATHVRSVAENFMRVLNSLDEEFRALTTLLEDELGVEPRRAAETMEEYLARARTILAERGQPMPTALDQLIPRHLDELAARDREVAAVCDHLEMLVEHDIGKRREDETPVMYLRRAIEALIDASHIADQSHRAPTILDKASEIDALLARNAELREAEHAEDLTTLQRQIVDLTTQLTAERADHQKTTAELHRAEAALRSGRSQKAVMLEQTIARLQARVAELSRVQPSDTPTIDSTPLKPPEECSPDELREISGGYMVPLGESATYTGNVPFTTYDYLHLTRDHPEIRCIVATPTRILASPRVPSQINVLVLSDVPTREQFAELRQHYPRPFAIRTTAAVTRRMQVVK